MARKRRRVEEQGQVPMSSMIDVVFLLLIYFIVSQQDETSEAHLAVNLPTPNVVETQEEPPSRPTEITVLPNQIKLRSRTYTTAGLREYLEARAKANPGLAVVVQTSLAARNAELIEVLDLCTDLGLTRLSVAALNE